MGYISSESVKQIREKVKKEFPNFKFSVTRNHHSGINISILEGDIQLLLKPEEDTYEQVNDYYIERSYADMPEVRKMLLRIKEICNEVDNVSYYETGDYGTQPSYYVYISVGTWEKPYTVVEKKEAKKTNNKSSNLNLELSNAEIYRQGYKVYYKINNKWYNKEKKELEEVQVKFVENLVKSNILKKER